MSIVHGSIIPQLTTAPTAPDLRAAFSEIEGELYFMRPDTIVVLDTAPETDTVATVSIAECLKTPDGNCIMKNDIELIMHMKSECANRGHSDWLYLDASEHIDSDVAISLTRISSHLQNAKYVHVRLPLSSEVFPLSQIVKLGDALGSTLLSANTRIAFVAAITPDDQSSDFLVGLQKAVTQNTLKDLQATKPVAIDGRSETTIHAFLSAFHGTQFNSRLLCSTNTDAGLMLVADLTMS